MVFDRKRGLRQAIVVSDGDELPNKIQAYHNACTEFHYIGDSSRVACIDADELMGIIGQPERKTLIPQFFSSSGKKQTN